MSENLMLGQTHEIANILPSFSLPRKSNFILFNLSAKHIVSLDPQINPLGQK
jgi:hypothetical protein